MTSEVARSGADYSITAGNTVVFAFVAVDDNEILTLGGLKAREKAEGAPLRLNVTNNKMTANTTVEVENNARLSLKSSSTQTTQVFNVLKNNGDYAFWVSGGGAVGLGSSTAGAFMATELHHATSKKFTDENYAPRNFRTLPELD